MQKADDTVTKIRVNDLNPVIGSHTQIRGNLINIIIIIIGAAIYVGSGP